MSSCTSNRPPSVSAVVPMLTKVERKMETTAASWIGPSGNFEDTGLIATAEKPLPIHRDELRDVQVQPFTTMQQHGISREGNN